MSNQPLDFIQHSYQCYLIGGGPGHDDCICYCHGTDDGKQVSITKAHLERALLACDDETLTGPRYTECVWVALHD